MSVSSNYTGIFRKFPARRLAAIVILAVSIIVFSNTLNGGFVWDDRGTIVSNTSIREIRNIPLFFVTDQWKLTGNPSSTYYRPVINTFWALEFQLWGENPMGYHITSIILHAIVSILFYNLCLKILGSEVASFFAALIFASHPVHTENIAWITGAGYTVCAIFIILSLLFYIRFTENQSVSSLMLSMSSFTFAVFSIEFSLMLPLVIIAYELLIRRRMVRIKILFPFIFISLFYVIARGLIIIPDKIPGISLFSRILTSSVIQVKYLGSFFSPYNLRVLYDIRPSDTLLNSEVMLSIFLLMSISFLMVYFYRNEKKAFFSLFWFFVILFPASNIVVVLKPQMMSLRYLYIPSMGLAMFSGIYIEKLFPRFKIIPMIIILFFSFKTFDQNRYWNNDITLYGKMVNDAPASALARNNLGVAYLEAGMPDKALFEFRNAVNLDPNNSFAVFNLGDTYQMLNKFDMAAFYLRKAAEINPSDSRIYNSLGITYKKTGHYQEAVNEFNRSLTLNPGNYEAHYNLANLLFSTGLEKDAVSHYMEFLRLAPAKYASKKVEIERMLRSKGLLTGQTHS